MSICSMWGKFSFPKDTLFLDNMNLYRMTDMSMLKKKGLSIQENHIRLLSSLDLPKELVYINASRNRISGDCLFEAAIPTLENLLLCENPIGTLPDDFAAMCPSLTTLSLCKAELYTTKHLRLLPLEYLYLDVNPLIVLDNLPPTLKEISACCCAIRIIQSKLPPLIEEIELACNKLKIGGLPLRWPSTLRFLNLSNNFLSSFPKCLPDSLEILNLEMNQIQFFPQTIPDRLQELYLGKNRILSVPFFDKKMDILTLHQNKIVHSLAFPNVKFCTTDENWNTEEHANAARLFQYMWNRYRIRIRLRCLLRSRRVFLELCQIALHPDRVFQTDSFSDDWSNGHIHKLLQKD